MKKKTSAERNEATRLKLYLRESLLPMDVVTPSQMTLEHHKTFLKHMGFEILKTFANDFKVKYPEGWTAKKSGSNWVYVIDAEGQRRFIFYYSIGVDKNQRQKTFINYMPKYRVMIDHEIGYNPFSGKKLNPIEHYNSPLIGRVIDSNGKILYEYPTKFDMIIDYTELKKRGLYHIRKKEATDKLFKVCTKWLKKKYPKYDSIAAYWDDEKELVIE